MVGTESGARAWAKAHAVDVAFGLVVVAWLAYVLRINRDFSFWADDLRLIEQSGSVGGLFEPYNKHMSLAILAIYRVAAEVGDLSYGPFRFAGVLCLVAVPVSYFVTTRRPLGPPLAAILSMPLLWHAGMELRPAELNHFLVLVGAIFCAAALNRGPRADVVLAVALSLALCSAGGGVVVAGACLVHNFLARPPRRRWLAVLVPSAMWASWWLLAAREATAGAQDPVGAGRAAELVRDLVLAPFYSAGLGNRLVAYLLMIGFVACGVAQVRRGRASAANFLAWSGAMVAWALALVQSRGASVDAQAFRYSYLALGFALLAVVPRQPIRWPASVSRAPLVATAAAAVLLIGGLRGLAVRDDLQHAAQRNSKLGREATGTMLVLDLGPEVIPDDQPIGFFGFFVPGSALRARAIIDRYGPTTEITAETIDQVLVDRDIVRASIGPPVDRGACTPMTEPMTVPGGRRQPVRLWASAAYRIEVRRFGDDWVELAEVPAGRTATLDLPALHTDLPWGIRADGACVIPAR